MPTGQNDWITLSSGELTAQVDPRGAQLSTLRDVQGRDLQWGGDPAVWAGRAPLLFPIVGELAGGAYRLGATVYRLPRHGFARTSTFEVVDADAAGAHLRLSADDATLAQYPFHFVLDVHFALSGSTLTLRTWIRNRGAQTMTASFGYHPAFRWPLPFGAARGAHVIEFAQDEPAPVRRLDGRGLLTPEGHPTPIRSRRLALDDSLFVQDALIFDEIRSRSVSYGADTGPHIDVGFPDAPYLGVWSKPGAGFVCIEPWHGFADPAGYQGDFTAKPGTFELAPGGSVPFTMTVTLRP